MTAPDGSQVTMRRMRIACWVTKATDTPSEYVILLFNDNNGHVNTPQCYVRTYIACLVMTERENVFTARYELDI
jgi:hypothetical protein